MSRFRRIRGADAASMRRTAGAWLAGATALALSATAVMPALLLHGLWATRSAGDSPFLLQRVHQYAQGLAAGEFPVRWMAGASYGLGYPFWDFYAPLAYALAAPVAYIGGVVGAIKVVALAAFCVAGLGAYFLAARTWRSPLAGVVAAASYTFAPYHMVNLYVRGDALSELVAYAIAPWTLLAFERARVRRSGAAIAGLALALAAFGLSHNVSALLFAPVAAAFALWRLLAAPAPDPFTPDSISGKVARAPNGEFVAGVDGASWLAATAAERSAFAPDEPPYSATPPEPPHSAAPPEAALRAPQRAGAAAVHPRFWQPGRWGPWLVRRILQRGELSLWSYRPSPRLRGWIAVATGAALGIALAAWFWLPALAERGAVHLDENVSGYFRYDASDDNGEFVHFRGTDLVGSTLRVDYSDGPSCAPCRTGLVQLAAALAGVVFAAIALIRRRLGRDRAVGASLFSPIIFWGGVAVVASVMVTPLSRPVWDAAPLLEFAQFPWRWLAVQALALSVLAGAVALAPLRLLVAPVVALGLAAAAMIGLPTETLSVHEVTPDDLAAYELLTTNIGSTVRAEYLPSAVSPRPWAGPASTNGSAGEPRVQSGAITSPILWTSGAAGQTWRLEVPGAVTATVAFPMFWFPGFRAQLRPENDLESAGQPARVGPAEGSGWLAAQIPPGRWAVELSLGRTGTRALAEGISLVALAALLALLLADRGVQLWRWTAFVILSGLIAGLAARAMPAGATTGPVTMDMERTPYPHRNPDGIQFDASRLRAAIITPREVAAGQDITVRLEWDGPWAGSVVTLDLVSPAQPVYQVPDILASVEATQSTVNDLTLVVPGEAASGLYFVRLGLANNDQAIEPASAEGFALGTVYLGPIRVTGNRTARGVLPNPIGQMGDLTLYEATVSQDVAHPGFAKVEMLWQTARLTLVNYKTSVRILTEDDENLAQDDKEPLYGFYPTMAWHAGEQVSDRRWLTLPPDLATGDNYVLEIVVYEAHSDRVLGRALMPNVHLDSAQTLPRRGAPLPSAAEPTPDPTPDSAADPTLDPVQPLAPPPFGGAPTATNPDS